MIDTPYYSMRVTDKAKKNAKTVQISFSLPLELIPLLNRAAAESGRTRSSYLSWLLKNAVERAQERA